MLYSGHPVVLKKNELCALFFILSCLSIHASPISDTRERRSMQINHGLATRENRDTGSSWNSPQSDEPYSLNPDELRQMPAMVKRHPYLYDEELEEEPGLLPLVKRLWHSRSYRPTSRRYQTLSFLRKKLEPRHRWKPMGYKKSNPRPCYWNVISCY